MNRYLIGALCAAPLLVAQAWAADDVMAGYYGNTIVATGGPAEIHTHYRADHTFDMAASMMMMHKNFKGTWAMNDKGEICRTFVGELPPNTTNPQCVALGAHKVGDSWTVTQGSNTRTLALKAGVN